MKIVKVGLVVAFIALVAAMAFTCPDKEKHQEAINQEVSTALTSVLEKKCETLGIGYGVRGISSLLVPKLVDYVIKEKVRVKNFFVGSVAEIDYDGKSHIIAAGAFDKVWVFFDSQDMEKYMEKQMEQMSESLKRQIPGLIKSGTNAIEDLVNDVTKDLGEALEKDVVGTINDILKESDQD